MADIAETMQILEPRRRTRELEARERTRERSAAAQKKKRRNDRR